MWALLLVLMPGMLTPRMETPVPIPYDDCIDMAVRVATYYAVKAKWERPISITCEVTDYDHQ